MAHAAGGDDTRSRSLGKSLTDYARGFAGGLLFSLPLLYTMEVWWTGFLAGPERLLGCVAFTFLLLLGYNRFSGFRREYRWGGLVMASLEELGMGLLFSALVLFLTDRITAGTSPVEILGKIVVEGAVVAIGVSVGRAQLGERGNDDGDRDREQRRGADREGGIVRQIVIAFCGAILFAASVAPTEEIGQIAMETSAPKLLGLATLSVVVGALILYQSNFMRSSSIIRRDEPPDVIHGSIITYAVALAASLISLWFFGRFAGKDVAVIAGEAVVLGFPATVGAAAGRLLLQGER